jgi:hypothetical protein
MRGTRLVGSLLLLVLCPNPVSGQQYDMGPLASPPTLPADGLPASPGEFIHWLELNAPQVPPSGQAAVREHVYALISAQVKARVAGGFPAFPPERDSVLAELFFWGDRLGVFGAYRAGRALDHVRPHLAPSNLVPPAFEIKLDSGYFTLASSHTPHWSIRFPYYFMVGAVNHQRMGTDVEGDVVVLSTLFAPNRPPIGGASQATILLIAVDSSQVTPALAYWLKQLAVSPVSSSRSSWGGAPTYTGYDSTLSMRKEVVTLPLPTGMLLVAYLGLDGTFEANHPHFLNLLSSIKTGR